ncbi:hypothetical protein GOBAR_AA00606 [Gossypium barbadense]|uniref:Uncharacterized protein n=1 Tax=Gossypium barbadense TaxID=3634 RepID=A0A2P5YWQ1_GOSBA|nr:hypothetical protein GOBAR_AA00606 [Gossypium barbadense]
MAGEVRRRRIGVLVSLKSYVWPLVRVLFLSFVYEVRLHMWAWVGKKSWCGRHPFCVRAGGGRVCGYLFKHRGSPPCFVSVVFCLIIGRARVARVGHPFNVLLLLKTNSDLIAPTMTLLRHQEGEGKLPLNIWYRGGIVGLNISGRCNCIGLAVAGKQVETVTAVSEHAGNTCVEAVGHGWGARSKGILSSRALYLTWGYAQRSSARDCRGGLSGRVDGKRVCARWTSSELSGRQETVVGGCGIGYVEVWCAMDGRVLHVGSGFGAGINVRISI